MGRYKLLHRFKEDRVELYDLQSDIGERDELSDRHPAKKAELLAMLHDWQKSVGAKMPTPNPDHQ